MSFIQVPGRWNNIIIGDKKIGGHGYATFRLKILLGENRDLLTIKIMDMATSYKLWVDDQLILKYGVVTDSAETMRPQFLPDYASFQPHTESDTLTLQVANYRHRKGGVWEPIRLGRVKDIQKERERNLAYELLLFGALTFIAHYQLAFYFIRKSERSSLFFSLVCLCAAVRSILVGERYFIQAFPYFSWELIQKAEYISFYLAVPAFFFVFS